MRGQWRVIIAVFLILWGIGILIGQIFNYDVGKLFWPIVFILLGLLLIFRPRFGGFASGVNFRPLADIDRDGAWQVQGEEIWMFVGDVDLDFSNAVLPEGETIIRILAFVPDVDITVPAGAGLSLSCSAFVTDLRWQGKKRNYIFSPDDFKTDNYAEAERKVRIELLGFVLDVRVD